MDIITSMLGVILAFVVLLISSHITAKLKNYYREYSARQRIIKRQEHCWKQHRKNLEL